MYYDHASLIRDAYPCVSNELNLQNNYGEVIHRIATDPGRELTWKAN